MTSLYAIRINKKTSWLLFWSRSSTGNAKCSAAVSRAKTAAFFSVCRQFYSVCIEQGGADWWRAAGDRMKPLLHPSDVVWHVAKRAIWQTNPRHRPVSRTLSIPTCGWCYSIFRILISKTALGVQRHKCLHLHFLATKCKNIGTNIWWAFDPAVN